MAMAPKQRIGGTAAAAKQAPEAAPAAIRAMIGRQRRHAPSHDNPRVPPGPRTKAALRMLWSVPWRLHEHGDAARGRCVLEAPRHALADAVHTQCEAEELSKVPGPRAHTKCVRTQGGGGPGRRPQGLDGDEHCRVAPLAARIHVCACALCIVCWVLRPRVPVASMPPAAFVVYTMSPTVWQPAMGYGNDGGGDDIGGEARRLMLVRQNVC